MGFIGYRRVKGIQGSSVDDAAPVDRLQVLNEIGFGAEDLRIIHRVSLVPGYIQHHTLLVLARGLYPQRAEGDEPEPIEALPWRLEQFDTLLERDDFTEARSIAALYLVKRFLTRNSA